MDEVGSAHERQLTAPLRDLDAWTRYFEGVEIPVLSKSADALEVLRADEDNVDANRLGEMIAGDPLMTLKVLAFSAQRQKRQPVTPTKTVTAALVMMGISPFFRAFGPQPTVEGLLTDGREGLTGFRRAVDRTHRGANFALSFAVHRLDPDASLVHSVALLHDFAELLLWCFAPRLQLEIARLQRDDPSLRSAAAQLRVLNVELPALQNALRRAWRLPQLLAQVDDATHRENANVRSVEIGTRLARHSAEGWDNPAIPDDLRDIAELLNISMAAAADVVQAL